MWAKPFEESGRATQTDTAPKVPHNCFGQTALVDWFQSIEFSVHVNHNSNCRCYDSHSYLRSVSSHERQNMLAYLKSRAEWFTLLGVITVGTSAVCTYFLPGRLWRSTALAQEPQPIALRELAGRGLDENPHVLVTEFECGDKFVSEISYRKVGPLP